MILNPKKRRRKAFGLAFKIIISYLKLNLAKKFISSQSYSSRLNSLHKKNAERAKESILELNGLFIKVGQLLSNLSAILPKPYAIALESLQDDTPHSHFEIVKSNLEKQLGNKVNDIFESFEEIPIASASIGQVHKAKLKTGEITAVKIQHPYIKELAVVDLNIIEKIHKKITRFFKVNGLDHAFEQVKLMIHEELDYSKEAESMQKIKENCSGIEGVFIPKVYPELSTKTILVTEYCNGVKITNTSQLNEWGIDSNSLMDKVVFTFCEMILNHGIYHADPHPGNLMVNENGELILLDFGAVGELKEEMRVNIPSFLQAIISEDDEKVIESMQKMGFVGKGKEKDKATRKIIEALTEFLQEGISAENLNFESIKKSNLYKLQNELSIKELTTSLDVPKDWILLERALVLLYGISTTIAPDYSAMDTIKPYLKKLVFKDGGIKKIVIDSIKNQATTLFSLPLKFNKYLTKANSGELEIEISNLDKNTNKLYALGHQILFGLLAGIFLIGAMVSNTYQSSGYESIFKALAIVFGVLLMISLYKHRKK